MPATPNDIEYFFKKNKGFLEEDIQQFYQDNLKHRKLREIVEEMQIEEDSEVGNVNNNPSSDIETLTGITLQASQRKKGTLH